jgi:hypothetical protein
MQTLEHESEGQIALGRSAALACQAPWRDLTTEEIATFQRDGVICLRGLYGRGWLDVLSKELDGIGSGLAIGRTKIRSGTFDWLTRDGIRDFILFGPTAKPVAQALGSKRLNTFGDQTFIKDAMLMEPTPWHHDATFFPIEGNQIAAVWTALDPVDANGSALEFVAGSHLWQNRYKAIGLGGTDHSARELEDVPDIEGNRESFNIVSWHLQPGDALLFHGLTLHGSRGNATSQRRRAIATRWTGDDVTYHAIKPTPWDNGLNTGERLGGALFPQIIPHLNESEIAPRMSGPIHPNPDKLALVLETIKQRSLKLA